MNRYLFLAFACLTGLCAYSQTDMVPYSPDRLVPGYVVLNFGDTITGKIQIVGYQTAPDYVYFSDGKTVNGRKFSVEECVAFGTNEGIYERWTVRMDLSFYNRIDYIIHNEDSIVTDTIFLKRAYKGSTLSLYKFYKGQEKGLLKPEDEKMHFFIYDDRNKTMQELIVKYRNPNKGRKMVMNPFNVAEFIKRQMIPVYKDQFYIYYDYSTEPKLKKKIQKMTYTEIDITWVIKELNNYIDKSSRTE